MSERLTRRSHPSVQQTWSGTILGMLRQAAPVTLLAVLLLGGCSASEDGAAAPTPTKAVEATPTATATVDPAETSFLENISHDPFLEDFTDAQLVSVGRQACDVVTSGGDMAGAKAVVNELIGDPDSTDLVSRSAIIYFCGDYDHLVDVDLGGVENPEPAPTGDAKSQYIAAVREVPSVDDTVTDDMIVMLGRTYCDGFTRGDDEATALGYMSMYREDDAKALLRATVTYLCPEHAGKVS